MRHSNVKRYELALKRHVDIRVGYMKLEIRMYLLVWYMVWYYIMKIQFTGIWSLIISFTWIWTSNWIIFITLHLRMSSYSFESVESKLESESDFNQVNHFWPEVLPATVIEWLRPTLWDAHLVIDKVTNRGSQVTVPAINLHSVRLSPGVTIYDS